MPTAKKTPKLPAPSLPQPPGGKPDPADSGEVAFRRLKPDLDAIPADRVMQPRVDVRAAASFVLSASVPRLKDPVLHKRFLSLPATEFPHGALDDLGAAAEAVLFTQAQLSQAEAGTPGAMLPVELVNQATALRAELLKVCAYHFDGDAKLSAQVQDIRAGHGYMDLAEDLKRLAGLYRTEKAVLSQDRRFYRPEDEALALQLSKRITSELRTQGPEAAREIAWRAWTLLVLRYREVERGAQFLLGEDAAAAFPPLFAVGRARPRSRDNTPPAPPVPPPTP